MNKPLLACGRILVVLLLLAGLWMCTMPGGPTESPPEDAVSFDRLLADLDELAGSATQNPSAPGMSRFSLPDGSLLSSADLSAYINAVRRDLAVYIYSCTGGAPYLVVPKRVSWGAAGGDTESGLIWTPFTFNPWKKFPVISYQHGTQVFGECAPSRYSANPLAILASRDPTGALQNYVECIVGGLMASAGYIVAMPDYAGFGASGALHPYVHLSLGKSVEGIVALALSGGRANGNVYLTGYSEGGYATMAGARALQMSGLVSPTIRAIVPCDGPYSLSDVMLTQMLTAERVKVPSYLLYTASGYYAAEPGRMPPLPYSDFLVSPYDGYVGPGGLFNGDHTNAEISALVPAETVKPSDMLDDAAEALLNAKAGPVYQLLFENDAWQGWTPSSPLVFVHCRADDVVPYDNAVRAKEAYGNVPRIVDVAAIPLVSQVMGAVHVGAFPTAMLEAFRIIRSN